MNRDEVIKGLECCTKPQEVVFCQDEKCPYASEKDDCMGALMCDALALLTPCVMTLEEVRYAYGTPMWFESKGTFRGEKGFWVLSKGITPSSQFDLFLHLAKTTQNYY